MLSDVNYDESGRCADFLKLCPYREALPFTQSMSCTHKGPPLLQEQEMRIWSEMYFLIPAHQWYDVTHSSVVPWRCFLYLCDETRFSVIEAGDLDKKRMTFLGFQMGRGRSSVFFCL